MRKPKTWDIVGAVGMLLGVLIASYSWWTTFGEVPPIINDWRWGVGLGLLIFFANSTFLVYKLYSVSTWSEPDVEIIHLKKDIYNGGEFGMNALLEVKNSEQISVKNCYATLLVANDVYQQNGWARSPLIPSMTRKPERLTWLEDKDSGENCEIEIPPTDSRHINVADTLRGLHYSLRTGRVSPNFMLGSKIHEIRIRIDGKFNEKPIKPLFFDGYIYYELRRYHFSAKETQNEEFVGTIQGYHPSPFMIFGIGDWTKDEEIIKALDYERKEGEKWMEENKKWVEENKKQIEKTTKEMTSKTKKKKSPRRKIS